MGFGFVPPTFRLQISLAVRTVSPNHSWAPCPQKATAHRTSSLFKTSRTAACKVSLVKNSCMEASIVGRRLIFATDRESSCAPCRVRSSPARRDQLASKKAAGATARFCRMELMGPALQRGTPNLPPRVGYYGTNEGCPDRH